jgi:hypothetical protein
MKAFGLCDGENCLRSRPAWKSLQFRAQKLPVAPETSSVLNVWASGWGAGWHNKPLVTDFKSLCAITPGYCQMNLYSGHDALKRAWPEGVRKPLQQVSQQAIDWQNRPPGSFDCKTCTSPLKTCTYYRPEASFEICAILSQPKHFWCGFLYYCFVWISGAWNPCLLPLA